MHIRMHVFVVMILGSIMALALPSKAQVNDEAYRDYFLVGQFGEVCTMCEVVVLCEAGDVKPSYTAVPDEGSFTLYHLETRTFWSQVSTIWEFFISNFTTDSLAKRGHTRPVNVYQIDDGMWQDAQREDARLILDPGVLELGSTQIDRVTRAWLEARSENALGFCQRLPLWDSLDTISQNTQPVE